MRVTETTIQRKRKALNLLAKTECTIKELSEVCGLSDQRVVHKLVRGLVNDHGFEITSRMVAVRGEGFRTRRAILKLAKGDRERALNICDDELGNRLAVMQEVNKIRWLAESGYDADMVASLLDKSRSAVIHIANNNNIAITKKRKKGSSMRPAVHYMDLLTIYRPLANKIHPNINGN